MKKTVGFWLNCLEDDIREKWLNNYYGCSKSPNLIRNSKFSPYLEEYIEREMKFFKFISMSFSWSKTPEGYDYWRKISMTDEDKLIQQMRNRKLKQLGI